MSRAKAEVPFLVLALHKDCYCLSNSQPGLSGERLRHPYLRVGSFPIQFGVLK
jgi:hypothetical protein